MCYHCYDYNCNYQHNYIWYEIVGVVKSNILIIANITWGNIQYLKIEPGAQPYT